MGDSKSAGRTRRGFLGSGVAGLSGLAVTGAADATLGASFGRNRPGIADPGRECRIVEVHVHPVQMRRIYTTKVAPAGGDPKGKVVSIYMLVELVSAGGIRGVGELSDVEESWNAPGAGELQRILSAQLLDRSALDRHRALEVVTASIPQEWHVELRRMLSTAIDMALLDLVARFVGLPGCELLGGRQHSRLPISWVAFIRDRASLEEEVGTWFRQGFRAFKLKVGADFDEDCEHVRTIRRITGSRARLKVDASGAWEEDEAIEKIRRLAELGANAVETPITAASRLTAKNNPDQVNDNADEVARALARVKAAVPIEMIEHVVDFSDAFAVALVRHRAVDIFNVAPCQAGSLERAKRLIHLAEAAGLRVLLGSTVELGPGTAAALHLGAASKAVTATSDLVGPGLLEDDVITQRHTYENGTLKATEAPGFGVTLDRAKLEQYYAEDHA